jgi:hypothetical protein
MARAPYLAAICLVLLPLLASAKEKVEPPKSSESVQPLSILQDRGFAGAVLGAVIGAILGSFGATWAARHGAVLTARASREEVRRNIVRELHKEFVYGSKLRARLRAELLLFHDMQGKFRGKNFEDMYKGAMSIEEYADVAAVLNMFRLLDEYKEAGHIDEAEAREAFGWIYGWWWKNVIEPYSVGLTNDPDWQPIISKRDWLLG